MMNKETKITSKKEYITPTIGIDELVFNDVLRNSALTRGEENITIKGSRYLGGYDLMDEIFGTNN